MIEAEGLTKVYGNRHVAIEEVTFRVERGQIVGFLGPNGAGKTTTMRILTGYMPPTRGQARIAGYDTVLQSLEARRHIGYLPETVPLYPEMSVRAYLSFMAEIRGLSNRKAAVERAMALTGVEDRADTLIGKLSKGYRQRVGLAQAILHNPDVLILDEPTIGLDPRQVKEVRDLIQDLGKTHTILLSTHILAEVQQICDRVLIIHRGRIRADMTLGEAMRSQRPTRIFLRVEGGDRQVVEALNALPLVRRVERLEPGVYEIAVADSANQDPSPVIAETVIRRGWRLLELRPVGFTLEDLFLRVTSQD
ncbi:MAG: ATP-binding cassette domain-containing protein [Anaerolineae bacterium]|nr:ABC transporter ATP-binding protein [Thermoflexus sp.]MDW8064258.1 ATP-binding cassette domain-containing protein [Anaerolineae bacterium]